MKISLKLPLTFAVTIFLLISAALFGIYQLNQSINLYQTEVKQDTDHERQVLEITVLFKTQVQEWKNVLLRGKDPQQLDKYWASFVKHEKDIDTRARAILVTMTESDMRKLLETFIEQHATMGANYRKGLEAFKTAQFDSAVGDKAVAGMDRAPTQLLEQLGKKILVHADASNEEAASEGRRAGIISTVLMLMLVVGVFSVFMSVWVTRSVVQPIQAAVAVAQSVASGDLSTPIHANGQDETAQLLTALHEMQEKLIALITDSVARVEQGSGLVNQAGTTMQEVVSAIQQVGVAVTQMDQSTQQNAAMVEEMAAAAASLRSQASELVEAVSVFNLGTGRAHQAGSYSVA